MCKVDWRGLGRAVGQLRVGRQGALLRARAEINRLNCISRRRKVVFLVDLVLNFSPMVICISHLPGPSSRLTGLVWGGPMLGSSGRGEVSSAEDNKGVLSVCSAHLEGGRGGR